MCHFPSWVIDKDRVYFMTRDIVESPEFNAAIEAGRYQMQDIAGHGIIYSWFNLSSGVDYEQENLLTTKGLPKALVEAIIAGEMNGVGYSLDLLNDAGKLEFLKSIQQLMHDEDCALDLSRMDSIDVARISNFLAGLRYARHTRFWLIFQDINLRNPAWI